MPLVKDAVIEAALTEKTVRRVAARVGCSVSTLYDEMERDAVFAERFMRARKMNLRVEADELRVIADDPELDVNRARLISDNLKWLLSRQLQAEYGDRMDINVTQTVDISQALTDARRRALQLVEDVTPHQVLQLPDPFAD